MTWLSQRHIRDRPAEVRTRSGPYNKNNHRACRINSENALSSEHKEHVAAFVILTRVSNEGHSSPRDAPSKWLSLPPILETASCSLSVVFSFYRSASPDSLPAHYSINRPWRRYILPNHAHLQRLYGPFQRLLSCETLAMPVRLQKSNAVRKNRHVSAVENVAFSANTLRPSVLAVNTTRDQAIGQM